MVNTIHFLEELHGRVAKVWFEKLKVDKLKPTQMLLGEKPGKGVKIVKPILVCLSNSSYYVVDGHKGVYLSIINKREEIPSIDFTIEGLEIEIVKHAQAIWASFSEESYKKMMA